ncbi:MAG: malto-oligosyltrehalose trehalohydrolase [Reyranella sp.]|uniref:malto-oligosyltrehalose trehalohydrolase n=1 Tax=Reyranella sp. TaxID=1929291 RepID=UPI001AC48CE9|nr:malto-oligosyltrehalose trehalohydrolase [Reyranella sp.]MBN9086524.1 malto-oligosyltrehalose trehalohydrolase [Reyranella sp.]
MRFGATVLANDRTRFRLWAPGVTAVGLEIDGRPAQPMTPQPGGWFETEARCGAGAAYRYRLPSGQAVPDPASRAQADDVHGPSLVVDPEAYRWRHPDWKGRPWPETVLYELHPGTCGGFAGIQADLGRLSDLGITAVELMPVSDFPGARNWGYDGVLPFAPDRAYGTPDELRALVDAAHGLGLMMFLDVVYNHFGPDGNYLGLYAPPFFRRDLHTPWGVAIDFRQPPVRRFFIENALYWLREYRFDGLRFDAVHAIEDRTFLDEMAAEIRATIADRQVHLVLEHDGNEAGPLRHGFDAQWNDDAHHVLHVLLTGERNGYYGDYAETPAKQLARCLAEGFAFQGDPSPYRKGAPRGTPSADLAPTAFVLFLQNHDQVGNRPSGDRLTTLAHPEALKAAVTLQLLAPNIPLLFMGEERMSRAPFQFFTDFRGELATAVREGRRREFAAFGGFGGTDIPDPNAQETFERSRVPPTGDDSFHRSLLRLRHKTIVPRLAGTKTLSAKAIGEAAVTARWRLGDGAVLALAANFAEHPCTLDPPTDRCLFASRDGALNGTRLGGRSTVAFLAS